MDALIGSVLGEIRGKGTGGMGRSDMSRLGEMRSKGAWLGEIWANGWGKGAGRIEEAR